MQLDLMPPMMPNPQESRSDQSDPAPQDTAGLPLTQRADATTISDWNLPLSLAGPIYRHRQNRFGEVTWILE